MSIFRAYDIRGIYGDDLTDAVAHDIGRAIATCLTPQTVVVGRDMRPHSAPLATALINGLLQHGLDVTDMGLCSTPMSYFANAATGFDVSVMITASHNPAPWNGLKICTENAMPIARASDPDRSLDAIRQCVEDRAFADAKPVAGTLSQLSVTDDYAAALRPFIRWEERPRIVADYGNAVGSIELAGVRDCFDLVAMYAELDGTFPNHDANPLHLDTLDDLCDRVPQEGALFGVAFDGDADRCGFVDEKGEIVPMDICFALLAGCILQDNPGPVLYDLRSRRSVRDYIRQQGGTPIMGRVGHSYMKHQMVHDNAVFAGELAGHYYFRWPFIAESSALALILMTNLVLESGKPLSQLAAPLRVGANSGEINIEVASRDVAEAALQAIRERYTDGEAHDLDGVSRDYPDWWFNVRASNTESKLRVILEADTEDRLAAEKAKLLGVIDSSLTP
jgi:phosphomannomutase